MATGARKGELLNARKTDVDLDGGTWTIPADHAKNGRAFVIPLAPQVVEHLRKLVALAGSSQWLIPGQDPREPASRELLNRAINALALDRKVAPHDLRRTMRSHLGALGVDVIVAEKSLNHAVGGLIDIYDRGDYLPQRRKALELWASFLACCEEGRPWNIEPLRAVA